MTVRELIAVLQKQPQDAEVKADSITWDDGPVCFRVDGVIPNQVEGSNEVVLDLTFEHN